MNFTAIRRQGMVPAIFVQVAASLTVLLIRYWLGIR
jgi:hypothetical protein